MTRIRLPLSILIVTVFAIIAVIAATSGATKKAPRRTVAVGSAISVGQTSVGRALVDASGRTLYLFAGDKANVSRLSASGQAVWPPFTSPVHPSATGGTSAAQIGTIAATGQVTYHGHPLYYYVGDERPGQASGQALNQFGARWYVVSAAGAAVTSAAPTGSQSGTSTSAGTATGYGY